MSGISPLTDGERQELIHWIEELFEGPFLGESGFPRAYLPGGGDADLLPELGDYVPLLAAAGARELALAQAKLAFERLSARPLLPGLRTRFPRAGPVPRLLRTLGATHLQDYAEILLGFAELHQVTHDSRPLDWAHWLARYLVRQFGTPRGLASFWLHGRIPVYEPLAGNVIEATLDVAELAGDGELRAAALGALAPLLASPTFEATGLWPSWIVVDPRLAPRIPGPPRRVDLAKSNTAMASALLRAYQATSDDTYRAAFLHLANRGLGSLRAPDGGLFTLAHLDGRGTVATPLGRVNSSNHAAIEVLLDGGRVLGEESLSGRAIEVAAYWRERIHPETGLLPDVVDGGESFVDGNTDFAVIFRKIHDTTHDPSWLAAAETLTAAVARWHRTEVGLASRTHLATGDVADPTVETRYTALYLKPLLIPAGLDVWSSPVLVSLLRDR